MDDKVETILEELKKRNPKHLPTKEKVEKRLQNHPNQSTDEHVKFWLARSRSRENSN